MKNKKRIILILGCILVLLISTAMFYHYFSYRNPIETVELSSKEAQQIVTDFFSLINQGKYEEARKFLVIEEKFPLREPENDLAKSIHKNIKIISINHLTLVTNGKYSVDMVYGSIDVEKIMKKATFQFIMETSSSENGTTTSEEQDDLIKSIYTTILQRDDLPEKEELAVLTLVYDQNSWKIESDTQLNKALEGNVDEIAQQISDSLYNSVNQ